MSSLMNTAVGTAHPVTARCGIRTSRRGGYHIPTAGGSGSRHGAGPGWMPSPGALRPAITDAGPWLERAGAGLRAPSRRPRCTRRGRLEGARSPAPALSNHGPASVMAGRKAPGLGIHPGPAPWRDPDPPAVGIWYPPRRDVRIPHLAVTGCAVPTTVFIKLDIARHIGRDVVGCGEALLVIV